MNYYNDNDPYCAQWLRNLIAAGLIPPGEVDDRDIRLIQPDDLRGFVQCHFFAGIAGWSLALQLAEWPVDRPIWTASCPCQPFSVAGKRGGEDDPRHLWPDLFRLLRSSRPACVVGEQVGGKLGYAWFDGVATDLEGESYTTRAVDIPACSVNAPQRRNRLYWVACTGRVRRREVWTEPRQDTDATTRRVEGVNNHQRYREVDGTVGRVACSPLLTQREPQHPLGSEPRRNARNDTGGSGAGPPANRVARSYGGELGREPILSRGIDHWQASGRNKGHGEFAARSEAGGLADPLLLRLEESASLGSNPRQERPPVERGGLYASGEAGGLGGPRSNVPERPAGQGTGYVQAQDTGTPSQLARPSADLGQWNTFRLIGPDRDGFYRRIEPSLEPLAPRLSSTMGRLRAYGNSIVPSLAAQVIRAFMDSEPD